MAEHALATRYAFLLQPVRDLAKNWDINIQSLLIECLQSATEEDEEGEGHQFNFQEAGMLVQSTSDVYGRKVEYLYELALGFNEQLSIKNNKKKRSGDADADDGEDEASDDEGIEAAYETQLVDPCALLNLTALRPQTAASLRCTEEMKQQPTLPVLPMSLMPLTEYEKAHVPLFARRNCKELVGQKDDFKINTGVVHKSGVLLLDNANAKLLELFNEAEYMDVADNDNDNTTVQMGQNDENTLVSGDTAVEPMQVEGGPPERLGGRRSTGVVENVRRTGGTEGLVSQPPITDTSVLRHLEETANKDLDDGDEMGGGVELSDGDDEVGQVPDDGGNRWANELEILKDDKVRSKIFKCKKNRRNMQRRVERMQKTRIVLPEKMSLLDYLFTYYYRVRPVKKSCKPDADNLDSTLLTIMKYISKKFKRNYAKKAPQKRKTAEEIDEEDEREMWYAGNDDGGAYANDDDDDQMGASQIEDEQPQVGEGFDDVVSEQADLVFGLDKAPPKEQSQKALTQMTCTEVLQYYLEKYWSASEKTTSKMGKRVQSWEAVMQPILEEEELRRDFDIHVYGSEILGQFKETGQTLAFNQLVSGQDWFESCRYMLATLMLANTGNIHLEEGDQDDAFPTLYCTLLNRTRHHEVFDDEMAKL